MTPEPYPITVLPYLYLPPLCCRPSYRTRILVVGCRAWLRHVHRVPASLAGWPLYHGKSSVRPSQVPHLSTPGQLQGKGVWRSAAERSQAQSCALSTKHISTLGHLVQRRRGSCCLTGGVFCCSISWQGHACLFCGCSTAAVAFPVLFACAASAHSCASPPPRACGCPLTCARGSCFSVAVSCGSVS
jgi:hypothetical protein